MLACITVTQGIFMARTADVVGIDWQMVRGSAQCNVSNGSQSKVSRLIAKQVCLALCETL